YCCDLRVLPFFPTRRSSDLFGPEVKRRIMIGTYALSSGYYDAYYGQAQKVRTLIARDFAAAFAQVDALISPTTPFVAFRFGERRSEEHTSELQSRENLVCRL